jgi:hypothetical protein
MYVSVSGFDSISVLANAHFTGPSKFESKTAFTCRLLHIHKAVSVADNSSQRKHQALDNCRQLNGFIISVPAAIPNVCAAANVSSFTVTTAATTTPLSHL